MSKNLTNFNIKSVSGKIAIVKANFNSDITDAMLEEAKKVLKQYNIDYDIYEVPGSFELPWQISAVHEKYDGFVALGCLIKGETHHYEYIAQAVTPALMKLSIELNKPIGFGVLTCLNEAQAKARINLGAQATKTVLHLLSEKK